jgi:dipeptidyl aminopeptidase/acylaminoacyl peptidase
VKQLFAFIAPLALLVSSVLRAELPPLIPRELLFAGNAERESPALSPDGTRLSWLAPDTNNIVQLWVKTVGKDDDRIVTADKKRGIGNYFWAKDNQTLLYIRDNDRDAIDHLYGVDLVSGNVRDYTPFQGVLASDTQLNLDFPDIVLVSMNLRDRSLFDVYRLNLRTGAIILDTKNPGDVSSWLPDPKFRIRLATVTTPEGGTELRVRASEKSAWKTFMKVGPEESLGVWDFTADGKSLYVASSIGRDTTAFSIKNIATGAEKVIAACDEVDLDNVVIDPRRHVVQAVGFSTDRYTWQVVDSSVKEDWAGLAKLNDGDFSLVDRTGADDVWLVSYESDRDYGRYYRWDRKTKKGTFLFSSKPKLDGLALAEMKPVVITARDGLQIHAFLTLPVGVPARNLPMVLVVHGGPWGRYPWGFNPYVQWYANRGYAVLQPNFRGSTGYGKKFLNAGDKQFGLKMQDDLLDSVNWAVKEGIADPAKIGITGHSYGGYCALAGVTFTPEVFACAVDTCGPSNLKTIMIKRPVYSRRYVSDARMGNPEDPNDAQLLYNASPVNFAHKIVRPLLIGQGGKDPWVNQAQAEQMVAAIEKNGGRVTYVLYPDEGHGFGRPENCADFYAREEAFLGTYLGGRVEPMAGEKIPGSTAVVRVIGGAK